MVEGRVDTRDEGEGKGKDKPDLLSLALFVYFVSLIVIVAGLLVLPALY